MALTLNGTDMSQVYLNGTRMEVVNINGTEVYRAENGNVTLVGTAYGSNYTFDPGIEDVNRHFVLVGERFSGSALSTQPIPYVEGIECSVIENRVGNGGGDGGVAGIFTVKIPTGTGTFTITNSVYMYYAIYRVTGIVDMTTALMSSGSGGTYTSSSHGCFFGATLSNFATPPIATPNSAGLTVNFRTLVSGDSGGISTASNITTGPTQTVTLGGNQVNAGATFAYDLY